MKLNKILAILNISELIQYEYYIQADKLFPLRASDVFILLFC